MNPLTLLKNSRAVSRTGALLLVLQSIGLSGKEPERALIRDRQGIALVKEGRDPQHPEFPYRALAPQLLLELAKNNPAPPRTLTIDARMQFIAERALRAVPRGAVVVVDPRTGDILAAASVPSFDPNALDAAAREALAADPTQPLSNRVFQAAAPGATFLPVTALAGTRLGMHFAERTFNCAGGVVYGDKRFNCWKQEGHGDLRLDQALQASCGPFFHQYGNSVGIDGIHSAGKLLGLGLPSGLSLADEESGILPNPTWLKTISSAELWTTGHTANVAIGQGFTLTTPLQLAMVAATIGNGGKAYAPRLDLKVPVQLRADLLAEGWTKETIDVVRLGLWKTVNESGGTGQRVRVPGVEVAGRTGTAQFWRGSTKDNHTWFIAFAPYAEPTLAICVKVEGAKSGGGISAPIAGRILRECLASPTEPRIEPLAPLAGSFDVVESVTTPPTDSAAGSDIPVATEVQGKPGFVVSPHAPKAGYIDVRGFPSGTEVRDPYTGKKFRVP